MKVFFRVDASLKIGTGHVMRCLALAEGLRDKGAEVYFICRDLSGNLNNVIVSKSFHVHPLPCTVAETMPASDLDVPAHAPWLEVPWQQDLAESITAMKTMAPAVADWLIVDHYGLDYRWESGMREVARHIMGIDDLADRPHDCDILLDQNYFEDAQSRYASRVPDDCCLVLGPSFALLRKEFALARQFSKHRGNRIFRVLVYFGGNDRLNMTGLTISAINRLNLEDIHVDVVIGSQYPQLEYLQKLVKARPHTRLYIQPDGFVELMLRADLAIGAGGTTTWERLCLNLPAIVITMADNQVPLSEQLHKSGFIRWIGESGKITLDRLENAIMELNECVKKHRTDSEPSLVDGLGTLRVAEAILPSSIEELKLRFAHKGDMETYFRWVNDPETRRQSFNQEIIAWPEHVKWFRRKLLSEKTYMWVMENTQGLPVGQIRFDIRGEVADIGYSLDPIVRGRGWSKKLLAFGLCAFKDNHGSITPVGMVKTENTASRRSFQHLGFTEKKVDGGMIVFHWL